MESGCCASPMSFFLRETLCSSQAKHYWFENIRCVSDDRDGDVALLKFFKKEKTEAELVQLKIEFMVVQG